MRTRLWNGRPGAALAAALSIAAAGCSGQAAAHGPHQAGPAHEADLGQSRWRTVWSDSFTGPAGTGPDPAAWKYNTGHGIFGLGQAETMTRASANVHLDGHGGLGITAIRAGTAWTSGRIETTRQFTPPAGRELLVTATIRQPSAAHLEGYWPAFWMLGPGLSPQSGEIDIVEDVNGLSDVDGTLHCGMLTHRNSDGTYGPCHEDTGLTSGLIPCPGCQAGYHSYSVVIDRRDESRQQIRWYLDGRKFHSVSERQVGAATWTQAVDHGFTIIFDLAIGGPWASARCGCATPAADTSSGGTLAVRDVGVYKR